MEYTYFKDNLKVLGHLFKHYREEKGYSIRGVSRSINVAHSMISDIENMKVTPNLETLKELYETISIPFCTDEAFLATMFQTMESMVMALYYFDTKKAKDSYNILLSHEKDLKHSVLHVEHTLAINAYRLMVDFKDIHAALEHLNQLTDYFTNVQYQLFNLLKAVYHFQKCDYDITIDILEKNRNYGFDEKIHTYGLYYLASAYERVFRSHEAMRIASEASQFLIQHHNTNRKIYLDQVKLKSAIDLGNFKAAENILKSLENLMYLDDQESRLKSVLVLLKAYLAYQKKQYYKIQDILGELKNDSPVQTLLKAATAYCLNDLKMTRMWLKKTTEFSKVYPKSQFIAVAYLFLDYIGEDVSKQKLDASLKDAIKSPYTYPSIHLSYLVYDLIMAYYKKKGNYQKACEIADRWFDISKKRDKYVTLADI